MTGCSVPADNRSRSPVSEDDLQFLAAFEQCVLPEDRWTHLAHIRVAWTCLSIAPPRDALARIRDGILRFNTNVLHRRHKYHETVTVAFARIVAARMKPGESWNDFADRIEDLLDTVNPVLLKYYSEDRLFSDAARSGFLEPDLEKLPPLADQVR